MRDRCSHTNCILDGRAFLNFNSLKIKSSGRIAAEEDRNQDQMYGAIMQTFSKILFSLFFFPPWTSNKICALSKLQKFNWDQTKSQTENWHRNKHVQLRTKGICGSKNTQKALIVFGLARERAVDAETNVRPPDNRTLAGGCSYKISWCYRLSPVAATASDTGTAAMPSKFTSRNASTNEANAFSVFFVRLPFIWLQPFLWIFPLIKVRV